MSGMMAGVAADLVEEEHCGRAMCQCYECGETQERVSGQ